MNIERILRPGGVVCSQGESIWFDLQLIDSMVNVNGRVFASAEYASIQIPTYVGGQIGAFIARKADVPAANVELTCSDPMRVPDDDMELRYYTPGLHTAAFELPAFVRQRIGKSETTDDTHSGKSQTTKIDN